MTLCSSYDSRVKAMEVEEKPKEEYSDVGGLDKQIEVRIRVAACYVAPSAPRVVHAPLAP